MKKQRTLLAQVLIATGTLLFMFASCSKDDDKDQEVISKDADQYAIAVSGGTGSAKTTYLQGLANFDTASLGNNNATELSGSGRMIAYNGAAYVTVYNSPATMTKYIFDKAGKATKVGELIVPGAKTYSTVEFVSPTEAYASVAGGLAKVIRFNPTTMERIADIDLTSILRSEAPVMYYLGMKARDGKLFMAVFYEGAGFVAKYNDTAYVAVIDLATAKVEKLIKDTRTGSVFLSYNSLVQDENGDIYVSGLGYTNRPSGILRIKKGQTDFDPAYFFDLDAATGKKCRGLSLFNNGLAFTMALTNPADDYEINGPSYSYYKIDIAKKTSTGKLGALPDTYGSGGTLMKQLNSTTILLAIATKSENSLYSYKIADGSISKQVTLTGGKCTGFDKLK